VGLTAPFAELVARVEDVDSRPLLSRPEAETRLLYEERAAIYRQAHFGVRTEGRQPDEIAELIVELIEHSARVPDYALIDASIVGLRERTYPVIVGADTLSRVGELARRALGDCRHVGVISDDNVAPLYGEQVRQAFADEGFTVSMEVISAGEDSKCIAEFMRLCEAMVAAGLDRSSAIVALGGGVVGDLAGYVAASLFRGVRVLQLPTSMLAMVDAAVGGKTGINIDAGKNLVGAFWQPSFVLADPEVLVSLPVRERRAALGELVKYALLDGDELYGLVDQLAPLLGREWTASSVSDFEIPVELSKALRRCIAIKSAIVSRDEREELGERALLNLGHTVGHAIEVASGYQILHGEAVALGLIAACRVSQRLGICDASLEKRVVATLTRAGVDVDLDAWLTSTSHARGEVLSHLKVDKKRTGDRLGFVSLREVGRPAVVEIEVEELARILRP
jgi:3-dehydroquinate synthase